MNNQLYTQKEFKNSSRFDLLPYRCVECNTVFFKTKHYIETARHNHKRTYIKYCSPACNHKHYVTSIDVICKQCGKSFKKTPHRCKKFPNHFCSQSCAATYNNTHKAHGTRRSKLEKWLEEQLIAIYTDMEFHFNRKDAIKSELDIYIPSISLAFELNGVYHYEPIHGIDLLAKIHNNDNRKFQACLENGIELCIIDTSQQKYFKPESAQMYLDIIKSVINKKRSNQLS